ncbi:MAG: TonB-dependent receptor [Candidatus Neomarinimicrobiota bacterium]
MPYLQILRPVLILLIGAGTLSAAEISGRVIDAASGQPVINANVVVEKMNTGAATDLDGYFTIGGLPTGTYAIFVSHIAYENKRLSVKAEHGDPLIIKLSETFFQLGEVVVTGTRTEKIHQNVPVTTEIISRKDIDDSGTLDLGELLNQRAGVATTASVEGGAVVNLMGIDSRYILILVDGQPITGKFNNRVSLEQVPTSVIEKIEIIKGPNSSLYGSEAMGGVINVITSKQVSGIKVSARLRQSGDMTTMLVNNEEQFFGPEYGKQTNLQTNLGYGDAAVTGRLNLDYTYSLPNDIAPHISVDEINRFSLGSELTYKTIPQLKLHSKYDLYRSLEESHSSAMNAATTVNRNNILADASYKPLESLEIQVIGRWSDYYRLYDQIRPWNVDTGEYESRDTTTADDLEMELIGIYSMDNSTLNIGFEQGVTKYAGERLNEGERSLTTSSLYGQYEFSPLHNTTLVIGTRWDDNNEIEPVISPRLAVMYALDQRWKLRAAYGRGYRQPSFMERYIDWYHAGIGYSIIGNPDLKPERSNGWNIGVEYYHPGAYQVSLMIYRTKFYDMIDDYIYDGDNQTYPGTAFSYRNINEVRFTGIEFQNRWKISDQWLASWGYNFVDNRDLETDSLISNTQPHTGNIRISYQSKNSRLSGSIKAKLVGPYYPEDFDTDLDDFIRATTKRETFGIFDLDLKYALTRHAKLAVGSQNILDYTDDRYGPFIGRRVYAEITTEF